MGDLVVLNLETKDHLHRTLIVYLEVCGKVGFHLSDSSLQVRCEEQASCIVDRAGHEDLDGAAPIHVDRVVAIDPPEAN